MHPILQQLEQQWLELRSSESVQELENRYYSLTDRDRKLLHIMGVALAVFLVYQLLISPGLDYLSGAKKQYQKQSDDYHWMESVAPEARKKVSSGESKRTGSLLSVASSTAKKHSISFNRFEPIGEDKVRLYLERVKFNDMVMWLGMLETEMGVSAVDISLDSASPGFVNVRLTLQG